MYEWNPYSCTYFYGYLPCHNLVINVNQVIIISCDLCHFFSGLTGQHERIIITRNQRSVRYIITSNQRSVGNIIIRKQRSVHYITTRNQRSVLYITTRNQRSVLYIITRNQRSELYIITRNQRIIGLFMWYKLCYSKTLTLKIFLWNLNLKSRKYFILCQMIQGISVHIDNSNIFNV